MTATTASHPATTKPETHVSRYAMFAVAFGVVFSVIYPLVMALSWQLFTYYPKVGKWMLLNPRANPALGPGMKWYGFVATAAIIAGVAGVIASLLPETMIRRIWRPGLIWIVPILSMIAVGFLIFVEGD